MKEVNRMILLRFLDKALALQGLKGYEAPGRNNPNPEDGQGFTN